MPADGATCLVNDRLHVALAVGADGGHVGADDLPVAAARRVLGPAGRAGRDRPGAGDSAARRSRRAPSYLGVGPCHATTHQGRAAGRRSGPAGVRAVVDAVPACR